MSRPSEPHSRRLSEFTGHGYDKGRPFLTCALWALIAEPAQRSVLCPPSIRTKILRRFGAQIGEGTLIRHGVRVHWPWKLAVGENSWIGVGVYLLNLEPISIGNDVCISQQAMLCTGSHDANDPSFEYDNGPITIHDGAWIAARATVLRGVAIGVDAVIGATALVTNDVPDRATVVAPRSVQLEPRTGPVRRNL